ncbi:MAG: Terminase small subunit [Candidatus Hydrogenedentes bacterium ADurb.Bin179]|nr:MAG: Terminase small subunit [Candidatus Hydrogenedentes bacterium ADurb.Bin179]
MNDLTAKQAAFVAAYLETGHIQGAAIKAGYAERGAHVTGSRLLRNPKIAAKIKTMRQKAETASTFTLGEAISILAVIARGDDHPMARIRAIETAARLLNWESPHQGEVNLIVTYVDDGPSHRHEPTPQPVVEQNVVALDKTVGEQSDPPREPKPQPEPAPKQKIRLYRDRGFYTIGHEAMKNQR